MDLYFMFGIFHFVPLDMKEKFHDNTDTMNDFISLWFGFISDKL